MMSQTSKVSDTWGKQINQGIGTYETIYEYQDLMDCIKAPTRMAGNKTKTQRDTSGDRNKICIGGLQLNPRVTPI